MTNSYHKNHPAYTPKDRAHWFYLLAPMFILAAVITSTLPTSALSMAQVEAEAVLDATVGLVWLDRQGYINTSLGTYLGQGAIYTHDHFVLPPEETRWLKIYNRQGRVLLETTGAQVRRRVLTPGKSSVLHLSVNLPSVQPAQLSRPASERITAGLPAAAPAWVQVGWPEAGLRLVTGEIAGEGLNDPAWDSRAWSGLTQAGDSGGGFWVVSDGELILAGNTLRGTEMYTRSSLER